MEKLLNNKAIPPDPGVRTQCFTVAGLSGDGSNVPLIVRNERDGPEP